MNILVFLAESLERAIVIFRGANGYMTKGQDVRLRGRSDCPLDLLSKKGDCESKLEVDGEVDRYSRRVRSWEKA